MLERLRTESRSAAAVARLSAGVSRQRPVERTCYLIGALLVVVGGAHLIVAVADPRPWLGPLSWRKPVTFGTAFGSILMAITWVTSYLQMSGRARSALLGVFATDCVLEVSGITVQAWRDQPSHFNNVGAANSLVAYSLAFGGVVLVVTLGIFAITAFRGPLDTTPSMRLALRSGFALLLAGLAAGIAMIARGERLIGAGHRTLAYDTAGFLKLFHGIALNAVLVLPLLAWWLARTDRSEGRRYRIVQAAVGAYLIAAAAALAVDIALF